MDSVGNIAELIVAACAAVALAVAWGQLSEQRKTRDFESLLTVSAEIRARWDEFLVTVAAETASGTVTGASVTKLDSLLDFYEFLCFQVNAENLSRGNGAFLRSHIAAAIAAFVSHDGVRGRIKDHIDKDRNALAAIRKYVARNRRLLRPIEEALKEAGLA